MPLKREFRSLGVERLAVVEFDARSQFYGDLLAVGRRLVAQRQLRHDVELFVDVEQLVAKRGKYDGADIGARQRRIENIGVFGQADPQGGLGVSAGCKREQQRGRGRGQTQDIHRTAPHLLEFTPLPAAWSRLYQPRKGRLLPHPRGRPPPVVPVPAKTHRRPAGWYPTAAIRRCGDTRWRVRPHPPAMAAPRCGSVRPQRGSGYESGSLWAD